MVDCYVPLNCHADLAFNVMEKDRGFHCLRFRFKMGLIPIAQGYKDHPKHWLDDDDVDDMQGSQS